MGNECNIVIPILILLGIFLPIIFIIAWKLAKTSYKEQNRYIKELWGEEKYNKYKHLLP